MLILRRSPVIKPLATVILTPMRPHDSTYLGEVEIRSSVDLRDRCPAPEVLIEGATPTAKPHPILGKGADEGHVVREVRGQSLPLLLGSAVP